MSLQYYDINLNPTQTQKIGAQGRYIYYYAGTTPLISGGATPAAAGNQAIKVQAGQSGNTILLMPGQSYRLDEADKAPTEWIVSNFKQAETITGQVLVGEGDFRDSNTSNTNYVKLDATFANNVKVTNDTGSRVPVALDPAVPLNIAGATVQYTNSFANSTLDANNTTTAFQVFAPATNVNGAYVEFAEFSLTHLTASGMVSVTLNAKTAAPANTADGDVLFIASSVASAVSTSPNVNLVLGQRIKIPAGKGLWVVQENGATAPTTALKTVLYTLL